MVGQETDLKTRLLIRLQSHQILTGSNGWAAPRWNALPVSAPLKPAMRPNLAVAFSLSKALSLQFAAMPFGA